MFKRIYFGICGLLFIVVLYVAFITLKPIKTVYLKDVKEVQGTTEAIYQGSGGDIYIKLKNNPHKFYVNRGLQSGLQLAKLQKLLYGKNINIYHINRWTPFTTDRVFPHISKITFGDSIIFNEIIKIDDKK